MDLHSDSLFACSSASMHVFPEGVSSWREYEFSNVVLQCARNDFQGSLVLAPAELVNLVYLSELTPNDEGSEGHKSCSVIVNIRFLCLASVIKILHSGSERSA